MWDFAQITKHVLCDVLKTIHRTSAKLAEPFIHSITKLMVHESTFVAQILQWWRVRIVSTDCFWNIPYKMVRNHGKIRFLTLIF